MKSLSISKVRARLPALIEGVAQNREPVVVMRYGAPMAMIVPVEPVENKPTPYPLRGQPIVTADDFDAPMPDLWNALGAAEPRPGYGTRKVRKP